MASPLVLISNPGSVSRKYALYEGDLLRAELRFEWQNNEIVYSLASSNDVAPVTANISNLSEATNKVVPIISEAGLLKPNEVIDSIGLRVVAPGTFFQVHRQIDEDYLNRLKKVVGLAPIHVAACLEELESLRRQFSGAKIFGLSDSAFHSTRPDFASYYAVPINDATKFDIRRFGYHGLSVSSVMRSLEAAGKLVPKIVVVHLGGGASATAVLNGKSVDNTMGFSPLDGLAMSTRSGSIDPTAVFALKNYLNLDDAKMHDYLNNQSGLLGLGGSPDVPKLIELKKAGDKNAILGLNVVLYNLHKGIAEMSSAMNGIDCIVLTGTVCERSAEMRSHITERLTYLDFAIDELHNHGYITGPTPTLINKVLGSKPIFVIATNESFEMLQAMKSIT